MKKEGTSKDELDILLSRMKAENSMPDKEFEQSLGQRILGKEAKSSSFNFFSLKFMLTFATFGILFLIVGIYGLQTYNMLFVDPVNDTETKKVLPKEKQVEVLNNFIENNPEVAIISQNNTTAPTATTVQTSTTLASQPALSEKKDIILSSKSEATFTRTTGSLRLGENSDLCAPLVSDGVFNSEQIQYVDPETSTYYYKNTKKIEDNIESYYLLNDTKYITFHGGKYAVFEQIEPVPVVEDTEPEDESAVEHVIDYFPQDTEVNEEADTYQIQNSFKLNCGTDTAEDWKTIVYVYVINSSDYTLESSAYYLDEINDENLISELTYVTTKESHTEEEIAELFEFEYDAELRDIAEFTSTFQERHDSLMEELSISQPKLVRVNEESSDLYHLTYAGLDDHKNLFKYMYDRDFYPDNEFGQKIYDRQVEVTNEEELSPIYSYSFIDELTNLQFNLSYFELENTNDEILDSVIHEYLAGEEVTINVEGEEIYATLYKTGSQYFLIFEFDNYNVVLEYYQFDTEDLIKLEDIKFGVWDLSNAEHIQEIDEILRDHFKGVEDEIFGLGGC